MNQPIHTRSSQPGRAAARPNFSRHTLAISLALASAGAGLPNFVQAEEAAAASAVAAIALDLPAAPLGESLNALARQAGVQIIYAGALAEGRVAPALKGNYRVAEALQRLLAGSGLEARARDARTFTVARPSQERGDARMLGDVVVTAQATRSGLTEGTGSYTTGSTSAATGLNLSLRETPQSVTVVTRQRLDDQNLNSLGQALAQVPGLSVGGSSSPSSLALAPVYSRGYLLSRFQIDDAAVSPYTFSMDGAGWFGLGGLDTALYDSVTVVRGSTGLLSGNGDPSGSVNLVRKRPTDIFQASLTGTVGRWDQYRTVADFGGPLNAAGTLRGRVVAFHDEGRSWVSRQGYDRNVGYAVLDADLGKDTLLSLALEHHREKYQGIGTNAFFPVTFADTGTATPFSRSDNAATDWSDGDQEKTVASLALEHRFNDDWQAKARYSHTTFEVSGKSGGVLSLNSDGTITTFRPSLTLSPTTTRSHEWDLRLNGRYGLWGRQHDLVAGFNGYRTRLTEHKRFGRFGTSTANALNWNGSHPEPDWAEVDLENYALKTEQYGLFLGTRLRPTDDLSVILGGRLSNWKTNTFDRLTGATTDDRKESSVFTPYTGIVYDFNKSLSAYASYTEIFNPQSSKDVNGRFLDPEEGKNVELGLKGEWFGGRLNASVAVFETRKDNLAVALDNVYTPDGDFAYSAEDGTKGRGWELEVSGELAPGWQLQGGYARIVTRDADGGRLNSIYAPKHSLKLFTTWKPAAVKGLTVGGGVQWQSETNYSSYAIYATSAAQLELMRQKRFIALYRGRQP
ncbi:MAG: TonB-dependent siderophore receptor [Rhodocyclaceae bacterium]|nr:TonB-dependent siderophore receptor [Rhodocyclaceae bacterium]